MRKRARRVVIGLGLGAAGLAICILALEREAIAMHLALWRVRLEGGAVLWPERGSLRDGVVHIEDGEVPAVDFLRFIADSSGRPIVVDARYRGCLESSIVISGEIERADSRFVLAILRTSGLELSRSQPGDMWFLGHTPSYHSVDWVGE